MRKEVEGRHALITGGSSGIGLACAELLLELGAKVTIVARNKEKLAGARDKLLLQLKGEDGEEGDTTTTTTTTRVCALSADVSSYDDISKAVGVAEETLGKAVSILVCSAGLAECKSFEDLDLGDFSRLMNVNYLGCVYAVRSCLPSMRKVGRGSVCLVSSQAGHVGLYGYTAYSPPKFALVGFAQALAMEVKADGIAVSVCYPPDTDTPQLAHENESKPAITREITGRSDPFSAERVALGIVRGICKKDFGIGYGLDGWMLAIATCGFSPCNSFWTFLQEVLLLPLLRVVTQFYLFTWQGIVKKAKNKKNK